MAAKSELETPRNDPLVQVYANAPEDISTCKEYEPNADWRQVAKSWCGGRK